MPEKNTRVILSLPSRGNIFLVRVSTNEIRRRELLTAMNSDKRRPDKCLICDSSINKVEQAIVFLEQIFRCNSEITTM